VEKLKKMEERDGEVWEREIKRAGGE